MKRQTTTRAAVAQNSHLAKAIAAAMRATRTEPKQTKEKAA